VCAFLLLLLLLLFLSLSTWVGTGAGIEDFRTGAYINTYMHAISGRYTLPFPFPFSFSSRHALEAIESKIDGNTDKSSSWCVALRQPVLTLTKIYWDGFS